MTQDPDPTADGRRPSTGHPSVDEVMRSVEELEERPVDEHVGVFETAQAELRRALDDSGASESSDA